MNNKMNRARQFAKSYNVQTVPVVLVDRQFEVFAVKVGGFAAIIEVLNQASAKARAERSKL